MYARRKQADAGYASLPWFLKDHVPPEWVQYVLEVVTNDTATSYFDKEKNTPTYLTRDKKLARCRSCWQCAQKNIPCLVDEDNPNSTVCLGCKGPRSGCSAGGSSA